jgi:hypothetical protein
MNDFYIILLYVLGLTQGLWFGWVLWRRPQLRLKRKSLQQLLDETPEVK